MIHKQAAPRRGAQIPLCLAIATALASTVSVASASSVVSASIGQARLVVPSDAAPAAAEAGAQLLHDYGAFRLYRVDGAHLARLQASALAPELATNTIEFNTVSLDTAAAPPDLPAAYRVADSNGPTLRIVQFPGPIAHEWADALERSGARIVQYIPNNAYVVLVDAATSSALDVKASRGEDLQYSGPYEPYFKLGSTLAERVKSLSATRKIQLTVQVVSWEGNASTKAAIEKLAGKQGGWQDLRGVEALTFAATEGDIAALAKMRDVFAVEEHLVPHKMDEVQDQIVAGNFAAGNAGPSGPGYLTWLQGMGFPNDPAQYPIVDIVDDGLGNGSVTNGAGDRILTRDGDGVTTRVMALRNCTSDALGDGKAGHGHLNTGIVGGYDQRAGTPYVDPLGYQRGLGINPYARLAHTKVFANSGSWSTTRCSSTDSVADLVQKQIDDGAKISSNSWGTSTNTYDSETRSYDIATRDAGSAAGNQPLIFVFAAGNDGSAASSVGTPGTAKNVITVGASENKRDANDESGAWTDGCGVGASGANNAMDVINFSSRGPAKGSRVKPEVIAPGTHVQSTASTASGYDGTGVCDQYRPTNQTIFAASSGTSHSTPAVAGMSSLVYYWLQTQYADATPSAAMIKAYFMAHPTYLTGVGANTNLPSNAQGYGMPNLGAAFDATMKRYVFDQGQTFTASGQTWTWSGTVADTTKPLRVAMTYSDAPGATSGNPQVNNLDLKVVINGTTTYLGNRFTGQWSTTGGTADASNNYEAVFLPAGTTGTVDITVTATNIVGDGVPNTGTNKDQDFALVCANCGVAANTTPVATGDAYATDQDVALTVPAPGVLGNDTDADNDTLTAAVGTGPAHGTLSLNTNGGFTYTPASGYNGTDSFTYTANDGHGGISAPATVNLTVNAVNHAPVTSADAITVNQGGTATALVGGATSVLANDTDADGDALTATVDTGVINGTLNLAANGTFTYQHNGSATPSDGFTYRACDTHNACTTGQVSITINLRPTLGCTPRNQVVHVGDNVSLPLGTLFADPEGGTLAFAGNGAPASLTLDPASGVLSGTPVASDATASPYTINVTAQDTGGASTQANLMLTIVDGADVVFTNGFDGAASGSLCQ